jgi:hypothetical protein
LSTHGVQELKAGGVQRDTSRKTLATAILGVTHDRAARRRQLQPDLMLATRVQLNFQASSDSLMRPRPKR